jgi:hypothetical protein
MNSQAMDFKTVCQEVLRRRQSNIMTADDLFFATEADVHRVIGMGDAYERLTEAQRKWLAQYQELFPGKSMYDLSQNPAAGRGRTSLKSGSAMCVATSSHRLWCRP